MYSSYLNTIWSFWALFLSSVWGHWNWVHTLTYLLLWQDLAQPSSRWSVSQEIFHSSGWNRHYLWPCGSSFPNPMRFPHMHVLTAPRLNTQRGPSPNLWSSALQLSPLLYSPWAQGALASPGSQVHFLSSGRSLGSACVSPPPTLSGKDVWTVIGLISFVSHLSGMSVLPWLMSNVLGAIFPILCLFFSF